MRFTLSSNALNSRLRTLSKAISSKNSLPILDSFPFDIQDKQLNTTVSDSENVVHTSLQPGECDGEGKFVVSSRTTLGAVKELLEQPLTFEVDVTGLIIQIQYQNDVYNFIAQNMAEYPESQAIPDGVIVIMMNVGIFNDNTNRSLFATAQDELRPVMNGIYFDLTNDSLAIVASDGHKLVRNKNLKLKSETPASFILSKKPAMLLRNALTKDEGDAAIKFDTKSTEIHYAGGSLSCRLIEGRYPNYNSVIPQDNPNQLIVDRKGLLGALRCILPSVSERSQLVRFRLGIGKLELSSEDIGLATSAKESIACDYSGQTMNTGFKGSSLTEILTNLGSEDAMIQLADPNRAGAIVPAAQEEDEDTLMLIMPMLLND